MQRRVPRRSGQVRGPNSHPLTPLVCLRVARLWRRAAACPGLQGRGHGARGGSHRAPCHWSAASGWLRDTQCLFTNVDSVAWCASPCRVTLGTDGLRPDA